MLRKRFPFLYGLYLLLTQGKHDKSLAGERKSFGEKNADKTFFIIKINNQILGLMGIYNAVLGYVSFAKNKGMIPVVDLQNYNNGYLYKEEIGKVNAWEYYFEQPAGYSLPEVYQSKNVVIASGDSPREASPVVLNYYLQYQKGKAKQYYKIINENLKIKDSIREAIEKEYAKLLAGKRVIGVVKRGTDIINAPGHAIQPTLQEVIAKTRDMLVQWNCEYVFLASEEAAAVEGFKAAFGDKFLINQGERVKEYKGNTAYIDVSFNRENDKFLKGLEYLTTVYLLSKCNCLIGSLVGATISARAMNMNRYENVYIYDLGDYK